MSQFRLCSTILCLVPAVLFWEPSQSWAWGGEAHEIIALVADRLLDTADPPVEKNIAEILAAVGEYPLLDWSRESLRFAQLLSAGR